MTLHERIETLCKKHNLSNEVKKEIIKLSKDSYIQGSNDQHLISKKYENLQKKFNI